MQKDTVFPVGVIKPGPETCYPCLANRDEVSPPGGVIYQDELWRLEHTFQPIPMAGWLILKPLRHVEAFVDLYPDELASFGPLVHRIMTAMHTLLPLTKVYLASFAEHPGFYHLHFHLIPGRRDLPPTRRGLLSFKYLDQALNQRRGLVEVEEAAALASALREMLARKDEAAC